MAQAEPQSDANENPSQFMEKKNTEQNFKLHSWFRKESQRNSSEACISLRKELMNSGKHSSFDLGILLKKSAALVDDQERGLNNFSARSLLLASSFKESGKEWSIANLLSNPDLVSTRSNRRTVITDSNLRRLNLALAQPKSSPGASEVASTSKTRPSDLDLDFDFDESVFEASSDPHASHSYPDRADSHPHLDREKSRTYSDREKSIPYLDRETSRIYLDKDKHQIGTNMEEPAFVRESSSGDFPRTNSGFMMPHLRQEKSIPNTDNERLSELLPRSVPRGGMRVVPAQQPKVDVDNFESKVAKVNEYVISKLPAWARDQVEDPSQLHKMPKWKLRKLGIDLADFEAEATESVSQQPKPWHRDQRLNQKRKKFEEEEEDNPPQRPASSFVTARQQKAIDESEKSGSYGGGKKTLGIRRGGTNMPFVPPVKSSNSDDIRSRKRPETHGGSFKSSGPNIQNGGSNGRSDHGDLEEEEMDPRLKGIDKKTIELIKNEIMDVKSQITWNDIAGLEFAKKTIKEIVVWPMLRPDIFTGLRGPPKGLLLFGPPGTGKTLIGKCIASQSKSTFFSISASSLTSKWVGEGEKMVRGLFAVARVHQPAVIFIDEIDSLLSQRSDSEHESSRRIKTEFLVQLDGATTSSEDRLLVIGATNRPQELDEAARRRLVKRLYIPLPDFEARRQLVINLLTKQENSLTESDLEEISNQAKGYSGADMANLCREAALGPIRCIPFSQIENISSDQVRPITIADFRAALTQVRASVSQTDLEGYLTWNKRFGSSDIVL